MHQDNPGDGWICRDRVLAHVHELASEALECLLCVVVRLSDDDGE